jgi:pimeloyl-ACP methyl ester carboxylesterase
MKSSPMKLEVVTRWSAEPGSRPPVLCVHGAWSGAWMWDEHFLRFFAERGYDAHALSLRGHGGSPLAGPLRSVRLRDYVDDVALVAASLPRPPVVVGHSMGGAIVQRYLDDHDVAGAALLCSVPPGGTRRSSLRVARHHPAAFLRAHLSLNPYALVAELKTAHHLISSPTMPLDRFRPYHARLRQDSTRAFLEMLVPRHPRGPRSARPVLVLGAAQDFLFDERDVRDTAAAYGTTPEMVPGVGHTVMLEPAWAEVAGRVADWMDAKIPAHA